MHRCMALSQAVSDIGAADLQASMVVLGAIGVSNGTVSVMGEVT